MVNEDHEPLVVTAAQESGSMEILQMLLHHGVDVDATNSDNSTTVMVAARVGLLATVQILVDSGANLNIWADRV